MSMDFFSNNCKHSSNKRKFGLCDPIDPNGNTALPAYLDEENGEDWIATVLNNSEQDVDFFAIDHCVNFQQETRKCDGMLLSDNMIAFVELKSRTGPSKAWLDDGEEQLEKTIRLFNEQNQTDDIKNIPHKIAYIANKARPRSRTNQSIRMEKFLERTEYRLLIKATIDLHEDI